ncbi:hypothetical protein BX600DRAFT_93010 [Xylariales sp. PMI_506]|nr:hypothetical protein BX600DRAFT_93010 [Xylariales sp. PMI_506]
MFKVPDAKRVRRADLYNESTSDEEASNDGVEESELREKLHAQLSGLLSFDYGSHGAAAEDFQQGEAADQSEEVGGVEPEEIAFAFRLFRDEPATHTIILHPDDDQAGGTGEGGSVVTKRSKSYYLAGAPNAEALARFRFAAVTPEHVIADAKRRRWGLEKPWKVTTISITSTGTLASRSLSTGDGVSLPASNTADGKRKRPGKKRRIILRTREKAKKEKEEAAKQKVLEKDEHLKEKKKRLNREKKLKRRAKERAKKAVERGEAGGDSGAQGEDGDDMSQVSSEP